ncbi:MAG: Holliday junction branch migration protein RuvA [Tissierellia bacterium]|nr:Holliday junction branch migration protein RuvA [Tissierellia bacterium]
MIDYIRGKLVEKYDETIVVESNFIGYTINISAGTEELILGEDIKIYTRLIVREDDMSLYGFIDKDSRLFFDLLKTVTGIGPRVANGIISTIQTSDLRQGILMEDEKTLMEAPGVGKKTAQRIILELKDKITKYSFENLELTKNPPIMDSKEHTPALEALLTLGYSEYEAMQALEKVDNTQDISLIIKDALKLMGR